MSALRRDLFERRLWPLVAVLIAAVIAAPVLLLKHASASGQTVAPPPHVTLPKASAASGTTAAKTAVETKLAIPASELRDPFGAGSPKLASTPATSLSGTSSGSSSSTSTASATTTTTASASMVSPSPTTSATTSPATTTTGTTATGTTATAASTGSNTSSESSQSSTQSGTGSWTIYSVDMRAGKGARPGLRKDVPRLAVLPSTKAPAIVFMGVMNGGRQAAFALAYQVQHWGQGVCRPYRQVCSVVLLKPGQTEHVAFLTSSGMQDVLLRVVHINHRMTHSKSEATAAYNRHAAAGLCELALGSPMSYSASTGTLSAIYKSACGTSSKKSGPMEP